ncbi:MAG TPA: tetratricopeptide repeat protein [Vicinamibacterales bacterium]|nr:tetratricopeptide repeat protein [Vicinamibacterales bacterium]
MVPRPVVALLLVCSAGAPALAAPAPQACQAGPCAPADFWAAATEIHQLKSGFVDALRQFAESAGGSYGDEGRRLTPQLDALQRALDAWDGAIAAYEAAARSAPSSADVHAAFGSVYLDRSRLDAAARELETAVALDARRADLHEMAAIAYGLAGNAGRSLQELEKASALAPDNAASLYRLAQALAASDTPHALDVAHRVEAAHPVPSSGQPDAPAVQFERIGLLRQAAGVAPIFPPARYVPGFRAVERGQYAEGLSSLRAAIAADPLLANASSAATAAGIRLRQGQLQAGLSALRAALAQMPDAETERVAGLAYWADEQYDKSIAALTAAVEANGQDERARIALADVLVAAGKPGEAERVLKETVQAMPDSGLAHYRLGQLYQSQSLVPPAIAEFERATTCSPMIGLDHLFDTIGGLYVTQADFDRAVAAYRRRIDVNPNNGEAHRKLGEIYALQGRDDAALVEFTVAQWLNPRDADALTAASQAYLRMGRLADAVRASRDALAHNASQQKARFVLGTALTRLGDAQQGQRELERFQREVDDSAAERRRTAEINERLHEAARLESAGDAAQAATVLRGAAQALPGDARVEFQLAKVLVKTGQPQDALDHLAQSHPSDDDAEAHRVAADAYAALGRIDARDREETRYRQLVEKQKEDRLRTRPLLR